MQHVFNISIKACFPKSLADPKKLKIKNYQTTKFDISNCFFVWSSFLSVQQRFYNTSGFKV